MHMQKVSSWLSLGKLSFLSSSLSCTEIERDRTFSFFFYSNFLVLQQLDQKSNEKHCRQLAIQYRLGGKWYGVSILHFLLFIQKTSKEVMWCSKSHGVGKKILLSHSLIFWNVSSAYCSQVTWNRKYSLWLRKLKVVCLQPFNSGGRVWISEESSVIILLSTKRGMLLLGSLDKNVTNSRKSQLVIGLDLGMLGSRINTVTDFKGFKNQRN